MKMERGRWSHKLDYILSMVGFCVGLGNIWRFPYLCMRNGGGAFLIPFIFFLFTCGFPLYFLEVSVGQFIGKGTLHIWEVCPLFKGVGFGMVIFLFVISIYYNIINTWSLYYIGNSFFHPLPWQSCNNEWNSPHCVERQTDNLNESTIHVNNATASVINVTVLHRNQTFHAVKPEEEFWQHRVLQISDGLEDLGGMNWHLVLCFLAAWIVVCLSLIKGVKSLGKVVYITATMPYILLTIILIRGLTLPGSLDGIKYYIMPKFSQLSKIQVWLEAGLQVFYSLGPTWGPLITMASYNKFNNNCYKDAILLTLISEGTSLFGGFAIFTIIGFMANKANVPIKDIIQSGPGLGFIVYPEALTQLPLPNLWAVLFFCMLFTVGLDSQFGTVEGVITALTDSYPKLRKNKILVAVSVCTMFFLLGLPICTNGGMYIFQLFDWYIAAFALPVFGILECVIFGWIYGYFFTGAEMVSRDVEIMLGRPVPRYMKILWCIITPVLLLILLVFGILAYTPPKVGKYTYPLYARAIGWFIACIPLIPIPIYAVKVFWNAKGSSCKEKFRVCLKPSEEWKPVSTSDAAEKDANILVDGAYNSNLLQQIKLNLMGSK